MAFNKSMLHLDYGDIIYDNTDNDIFCQKIEYVQENAVLPITNTWNLTRKTIPRVRFGIFD